MSSQEDGCHDDPTSYLSHASASRFHCGILYKTCTVRTRLFPAISTRRRRSARCTLLSLLWRAVPMAGCQNTEADSSQKSFHRGDSSLFCSSRCEALQETEEEDKDEEAVSSPAPDYAQQLCSILGPETADYFLNPPPMEFHVSPSVQKILDEMEDSLGAEELWRILQTKSKQKLKEEYGEPIRLEKINILKNFAQRPAMQKVVAKRHHLTYMRQTLLHQQDLTNMLLSDNPLPDMNGHQRDLRGTSHRMQRSHVVPSGTLTYKKQTKSFIETQQTAKIYRELLTIVARTAPAPNLSSSKQESATSPPSNQQQAGHPPPSCKKWDGYGPSAPSQGPGEGNGVDCAQVLRANAGISRMH
ncbi:PREDICTED: uncharacterized protein LOC108804371 [Nanorana parkeri]|uniref:uncharacterized protein LOC108804371 n=1 Tax=Nanorana parkeri TaxID=125878 RepID=UPI0008540A93|nr:PREDICTED: uncharacterized protein LOC108804371 [Nanorana parkeri]